MEVIGAGWGRTGTLSLKEALDTLGLPCYHMLEVIKRGDEKKWLAAAEGEPVDFAQVLSDYKACVDWPAASFYKELMEVYPNAKVILSVRDPAKWYNSTKTTIWKLSKVLIETPWYARTVMGSMADKLVWQRDLQGCFEEDPQKAQQLFMEWNEHVKQHVPADKLLVFEPSMGWEPLCKFLGKPIPDQPFPHKNDIQMFNRLVAFMRARSYFFTYVVPSAGVAALAAGVAAVLRYLLV